MYTVPEERKGKRRTGRKKLTWWSEEPVTQFRGIFIKWTLMDRAKGNSEILVKTVGKVFCREIVLKNKTKRTIRHIEEKETAWQIANMNYVTKLGSCTVCSGPVPFHFSSCAIISFFSNWCVNMLSNNKDISQLSYVCKYFPFNAMISLFLMFLFTHVQTCT